MCATHTKTLCKVQKLNKQKTYITNFAIAKQKKTSTTQGKNVTPTKYAHKKILHGTSMQHERKSAQYGLPGQTNLATAFANIFGNS